MTYPHSPGFKTGSTSAEAAASMEEQAATLRYKAHSLLLLERLTADEVAGRLGESILAMRPRLSELHAVGSISDSGERRCNRSGRNAIVWKASEPGQPVTPFAALPLGHYGAILADPPWSFRTYGGDDTTPHRTDDEPYTVMSIDDIRSLPVASLAARDCALFLWVVDPLLDVCIEVGKAWGFEYKTRAFEWAKTKLNGDGYGMGMGYWTRKQGESCLLFTRGSPARKAKDVRQFIEEPRREHSRKPDETYRRIERLVAGPYVELFATQRWPGWDGWGDQYPELTLSAALQQLTRSLQKVVGEQCALKHR